MHSRRKFISKALLAGLGMAAGASAKAAAGSRSRGQKTVPVVVSTWNNLGANREAWTAIQKGQSALDAVEQGVRVVEANPRDMSVGYGGRPDRDGNVTLDACIMSPDGNCGSVCFLKDIMHPISVARLVMEKTPHVMLAGEGALKFALENGFKRERLLTKKAEKEWKAWMEKQEYAPEINIENHDTIGMLAIGQDGNMAGACTTSGAAYKLQGRVGDSPIIGAGLYLDNEVGGAVATGLGEAVIKTAGSFLIVELMRQGKSPQEACEEAVRRITSKQPGHEHFQVGFLALSKDGEAGAFAIHEGFLYAHTTGEKHETCKSAFALHPQK